MTLKRLSTLVPSWKNVLLSLLAAGLLILAFPPFELWFTAWFALVPLLWAIERETERGHSCPHEPEGRTNPDARLTVFQTLSRSFVLGWLFGNVFFYGTCWWLTYAPINYASFPAPLAYFLLFLVTSAAAVFPGIFAAITAFLLRRFGSIAFLAVPFVWVFTEFARYWLTGNNWNAVGYSQAFAVFTKSFAIVGGILFVSFACLLPNAFLSWTIARRDLRSILLTIGIFAFVVVAGAGFAIVTNIARDPRRPEARVIALQPNVPMSGLNQTKWDEYRRNHVRLAESALATTNEQRTTNNEPRTADNRKPTTVIFPESPMNFMYEVDPETKEFIDGLARKNQVSMLFNSAEPDRPIGPVPQYYNSAVMVGPAGGKVAQYDKIFLLPFGEAVPFPFDFIVPAFVGSFSYGSEYDLFPLGDAKAGVMICFESHFGQLSREYVRNGADVIIEMTNDGYLGPTPVLRQHLANAVFRAVETNRPVLRVTNVGITAYINHRGEVLDAADSYVEATRVWSVAKSDGSQTFYVKYGDWFAWLCSIVTVAFLILGIARQRSVPPALAGG